MKLHTSAENRCSAVIGMPIYIHTHIHDVQTYIYMKISRYTGLRIWATYAI